MGWTLEALILWKKIEIYSGHLGHGIDGIIRNCITIMPKDNNVVFHTLIQVLSVEKVNIQICTIAEYDIAIQMVFFK